MEIRKLMDAREAGGNSMTTSLLKTFLLPGSAMYSVYRENRERTHDGLWNIFSYSLTGLFEVVRLGGYGYLLYQLGRFVV